MRKRPQRYWEDVEIGEELAGFSLEINTRRVFLQISGTQDWYPLHFDPQFARRSGHQDIFMNTGFLQAALVRVITDWMGDEGFLKKLYFEMRRQQRPGDIMTCKGRVVDKYVRDGQHYVECEVWAENEREGITTPGRAWVILPSRQGRPPEET
ncbi:MAG: MaoC family dehydratase N-terminal domain-containing protein [Dehalococcoidia bacterium]|jgi:acyl dehydratase|nr:MaoC family dehydratase N-terminal domain-containing protein [Dehalococcoidia bacterium]